MAQRRSDRPSLDRVPNDRCLVLAGGGNKPAVRTEFCVDDTIPVREGWANLLPADDIPHLSHPRQLSPIGHAGNYLCAIGTESDRVYFTWMHEGTTDPLSCHRIPNLS